MKPKITSLKVIFLTIWLLAAAPAFSAPHEVRLPLHNGVVHTPDLITAICRELRLPRFEIPGGDIRVSELSGSILIRSLNAALGDGCRLTVDNDALVLHVDASKLPVHQVEAEHAIRVFTAQIAPEATARQARHWGLFVPEHMDVDKPLVVLIHGLDSEKECMASLAELLHQSGYQVGYFSYPDDQAIHDSTLFFAERMIGLRQQFPTLKLDIIAHSMGGLVVRDYIEGNDYAGGVDRLIMVGTPNGGSSWSSCRFLLEAQEQFHEWRHDPEYSCTWSITDGLGEAGRNLKPHSKFLNELNSRPRRTGIRYTIIAGNQSPTSRMSADLAEHAIGWIPTQTQKWWGIRQCKGEIQKCADHFRHSTGKSDGPVNLSSTALAGVGDVVTLPVDHAMLISSHHGLPPAAWETIRNRISQ